ncbi:lipase family alpha/beta hydrolase [Piscinibacter sp.]|uniref:lipase family alpha/beta hydrolase n=1 Tax=Piscinibacter sp. TaxID=1903157 RepID=UPI0039E5E55A
MLARLQQVITLSLLAFAVAWAGWFARQGRWGWALGGALLILFGYALVLAIEFVLLGLVHGDDPAPRAGPAQLLRAWWGEVLCAPSVFCWRQPFRSRAEPDHLPAGAAGRLGVVLVHGFVCNRGFWNPWLRRLRAAGVPVVAVNLEPVFGRIDDYAPIVAQAVARVRQATGRAPLVVAHSMGGLAVRRWLSRCGEARAVEHVVTIGTPHHGTWLARFGHTPNGVQMRRAGDWLGVLAGEEGVLVPEARYARFTCFYSHCDNIVFPPSTATLPGADNRHVAGCAHVHLAFQPEVFDAVWSRVSASPESPVSASNSGAPATRA